MKPKPVLIWALISGLVGCTTTPAPAHHRVYLDLVVAEGGVTQFPDPLLVPNSSLPADLRSAVNLLLDIVPAAGEASPATQAACTVKSGASISSTFVECAYSTCKLLPEKSRVQDCAYWTRVEEWVQREWLGGLCLTVGADEAYPLAKWFIESGTTDCSEMSELVMFSYMQSLATSPPKN